MWEPQFENYSGILRFLTHCPWFRFRLLIDIGCVIVYNTMCAPLCEVLPICENILLFWVLWLCFVLVQEVAKLQGTRDMGSHLLPIVLSPIQVKSDKVLGFHKWRLIFLKKLLPEEAKIHWSKMYSLDRLGWYIPFYHFGWGISFYHLGWYWPFSAGQYL